MNNSRKTEHKCHRCGKPGHYRKDCRVNLRPNDAGSSASEKPANSARRWSYHSRAGYGNRGRSPNVTSNSTEVSSDPELSTLHVRVLSSEVATRSRDSSNNDSGRQQLVWVVDSGCTDHIVNSDKYFYSKVKN